MTELMARNGMDGKTVLIRARGRGPVKCPVGSPVSPFILDRPLEAIDVDPRRSGRTTATGVGKNGVEKDGKLLFWKILPNEEKLVVKTHAVEWFVGGVLHRRFGFQHETVTHAVFTYFEDPARPGKAHPPVNIKGRLNIPNPNRPAQMFQKRAIVIFIHDFAHIYFVSGAHYIASIPFAVRQVLATDRGLLIERAVPEQDANLFPSSFLNPASIPQHNIPSLQNMPRFFSLSDPLMELGLVTKMSGYGSSLSDAQFAASEHLVFVSDRIQRPPQHALLAATYDPSTKMLNIYQFSYVSNDGNAPARRRTMSRRRSSMLHSLNEDISAVDSSLPLETPGNRRVSASRHDTSLQVDRMGAAGLEIPDGVSGGSSTAGLFLSWWYDVETLKREVEFSLIEAFPFDCESAERGVDYTDIKAFNLVHQDQKKQTLCFLNRAESVLFVLTFSLEGHRLRFENSTKLNALDAAPLCDTTNVSASLYSRRPSIFVVVPDRTAAIFDPILQLWSPQVALRGAILSVDQISDAKVSIQMMNTEIYETEIVLYPRPLYIQKAAQIIETMMTPAQQAVFEFYFSAALHRLEAISDEVPVHSDWKAFVISLLVFWIGPGSTLEMPSSGTERTFENFMERQVNATAFNTSPTPYSSWPKLDPTSTSAQKWFLAEYVNEAVLLANEFKQQYAPDASACSPNTRAYITVALHLFVEELKLDIVCFEAKMKISTLMGQLVRWLGWDDEWREAYITSGVTYDEVCRFPSQKILSSPPGIFSTMYEVLTTFNVPPMPTLYDLYSQQEWDPAARPQLTNKYLTSLLPRSSFVSGMFKILANPAKESIYRDIIEYIFSSIEIPSPSPSTRSERTLLPTHATTTNRGRLLNDEIERYPECFVVLFREAILWCQENTPIEWGVDLLEFIGRRDLKKLVETADQSEQTLSQITGQHRRNRGREHPREMVHIAQSITLDTDSTGPWDGSLEADHALLSRLIFREDRRLSEVQKMLQTTRMQSEKFEYSQLSSTFNEADMHSAQQELARMVGTRTLAVPVGRGAILYCARVPLMTEKFPIPKMNFNILMKPSMATITVDKHLLTEENISWGLFHNGVAAGLSVAKDAKEITGSWIVYNKPAALSSQHAGFLLGLGLNGHLKNLAEWHIYNYLRPKHTHTSIALLLGMSASYLGTMDPKMTKVLSVHVVALLPSGSADLNIMRSMQTAGIMGVGLLYYNSRHRRMSEILISEIDQHNASGVLRSAHGNRYSDSSAKQAQSNMQNGSATDGSDISKDEGYLLAVGFALGLINIGAGAEGSEIGSLTDLHLMERLLAISTGTTGSNGGGVNGSYVGGGGVASRASTQKHHLLDRCASGSIMALLLIYLKTENEGVAQKIDVPETEMLFEYVRPDLLLLRTLASRLIMWSTIGKDMEWIMTSIRPFLRTRANLQDIVDLDSDDLPLLNIVCGLCFAMGVRYAGSVDAQVKQTLIYYLDHFMRLCSLPANTHDQRMTKATARTCQSVLVLAVSVVMSGTGDIDVMRRIRKLHGTVDAFVSYGSHLANHLALGILLLGGGEYSIDTGGTRSSRPAAETDGSPEPASDEKRADGDDMGYLATAGLIIALYPQFPNDVLDNQVHLQAFRHFWTFACQRRCLVVRDIETLSPVVMPITVSCKKDRDSEELVQRQLTAPCLLPPLDTIAWLKTTSPEHWPVTLDLQTNEAHRKALSQSLTIYTEDRKSGQVRRRKDGAVPFGDVLRGLGPPLLGEMAAGTGVPARGWSEEEKVRAYAETLQRGWSGLAPAVEGSSAVMKLLEVGLHSEMDQAEKALIVPPGGEICLSCFDIFF
ncbi:hypothetical protein BZA70DRAFT_278761 [Myxozyma melibiosi]|uniref:Anaphase-promoting complex subunit 1 n=1 Tax=Myxozyma melibiosi TaxID=54550 RepID=A0ABR1F587_9ASCO